MSTVVTVNLTRKLTGSPANCKFNKETLIAVIIHIIINTKANLRCRPSLLLHLLLVFRLVHPHPFPDHHHMEEKNDSHAFEPLPNPDLHEGFLRQVVDLLMKKTVFGMEKVKSKVVEWTEPEELKKIMDFRVDNVQGISQREVLKLLEDTINYSVKTGHPYFLNQLYSGLDPYGLAGQWVTDALNASVYTYEVAPVFTLMEQYLIEEMCKMIGPKWTKGDALFCPGGSFANGSAINLARYNFCPDIKYSGISHMPRLVVFTSEESHYSIHKMASLLGIGDHNVVQIKTDNVGKMILDDLESKICDQINLGAAPFCVVATAGTTVRGAFDPFSDIYEICEKYKLWFHIDGAWGGGLIFSKKYRHKLAGMEKADSVLINAHKLLSVPQQCSLLFVKNGGLIKECHGKGAQYIFQKDKFYDTAYDCGDKYLQCARRCDVLKFWLMWKAKGSSGFEKHVDSIMATSQYFAQEIRKRPEFRLCFEPQYVNVCFWYLPQHLQNFQPSDYPEIHKIAPRIKEVMIRDGKIMMGYQPLKNLPNFFRYVSQNSAFTVHDVNYLLDYITKIGKTLSFN